MSRVGSVAQGGETMLNVLLCLLIFALLAVGTYYASHRWVQMRHSNNMIADELKRSLGHIEDLENKLALLEAEMSLRSYKEQQTPNTNGWDAFAGR